MADWWQDNGVDFNLFGGDQSAWFDTSFDPGAFDNLDLSGFNFDPSMFNFDYNFPTFDPGQFDLGFNPQFDIGQYASNLGDPFALPTGDLNLPQYDLSSMLSKEPTFNTGDFNPSLNAFGSYDFGTNLWGDTQPVSPDLLRLEGMGGSLATPDTGTYSPFSTALNLGDLPGATTPALAGSNTGKLGNPSEDARTAAYNAQASASKAAPWLQGGQLALGLGGALAGALSGPPQKKVTQFEKDQAAIEVQLKREELALRERIAQMQADAAKAGSEVPEPIKPQERVPLFGTDPRFSALYNQVTGASQGLSPDNPEIQAMTQQIYSVRIQAATQEYEKQRAQVLEQANRLGVNPAQQLSDIDAAEQKAKQALMVEAQQQALAFAQARLDPANQLLQSILKVVV